MNRHRIGRVVAAGVALMLVILVSRGVALAAAPGNPFDQVLGKLDAIIETLTPTRPVPEGEVRLATPALYATEDQSFDCVLANIGTETLTVVVHIIDLTHEVDEVLRVIAPGATSGTRQVRTGWHRCEFTFTGSAESVRANLQLFDTATKAVASVDAR